MLDAALSPRVTLAASNVAQAPTDPVTESREPGTREAKDRGNARPGPSGVEQPVATVAVRPFLQKERRREASVPLDADETGSARHEDRLPVPMEMRIGAPATDGGVALREPVAKFTSQ